MPSTATQPVTIQLTPTEGMHAASSGVRRRIQNIVRGIPDNPPIPPDRRWTAHITGAMGELAVARALNIYWDGIGGFTGHDVGTYEVRTRTGNRTDLLLRTRDHQHKPDTPYISVHATDDLTFTIHGWTTPRAACIDQHRADQATWFVPIDHLRPIADLPGSPNA